MTMKKPKVPCHNCTERCVTLDYNCHSDCERYQAFCQKNLERNKFIREQKAKSKMVDSFMISVVNKVQHKKVADHIHYRKGK